MYSVLYIPEISLFDILYHAHITNTVKNLFFAIKKGKNIAVNNYTWGSISWEIFLDINVINISRTRIMISSVNGILQTTPAFYFYQKKKTIRIQYICSTLMYLNFLIYLTRSISSHNRGKWGGGVYS